VEVRVVADSYTNIAAKVASGFYGNGNAAIWFGWGTAVTSPDPSLTLVETFHSESPTAGSAGFRDDEVDGLLNRIQVEFDLATRAELALDVQRRLMGAASGGLLSWLLQSSEHFSRAYLVGSPRTPFHDAHLDAARWIDPSAPGYDLRIFPS
jgi:ABC-type transport system substrate-binding protein